MDSELDYFGLDEAVKALEARLEAASDQRRLEPLAALAWYLRQRDTRRARTLAEQGLALLAAHPADAGAPGRARVQARLRLTLGEAHWLFGELDAAEACAAEALDRFGAIGDGVGTGDAEVLQSWIAHDTGALARRGQALERARAAYDAAGDAMRRDVVDAIVARDQTLVDPSAAAARWGPELTRMGQSSHPGLQHLSATFWAQHGMMMGEYGAAIAHFQRAVERGALAGCRRLVLAGYCNLGIAYRNLGDPAYALELLEQALEMVRPTGWPFSTGIALQLLAGVLSDLEREAFAREMLAEAVTLFAPFQGGRVYANTCQDLGKVELGLLAFDQAVLWFCEAERIGHLLGQRDVVLRALLGQAISLARFGHAQEAGAAAEQALALARLNGDAATEFDALQAMGEAAGAAGAAAPEGSSAPSGAVHYREEALRIAAGMPGYTVLPYYYTKLAEDYEAAGDLRRALDCERSAAAAQGEIRARQAASLATSIQIRYDTAQAKMEAVHQRALAAAEAERSAALLQSNAALEQLARSGQEITASLDRDLVCQTLLRCVGDMLPGIAIDIWLLQRGMLERQATGAEPVPRQQLALHDTVADVALCAREQREVLAEGALHGPLVAGGNLLGVLSVRGDAVGRYGARQRQILHTLLAYGGVALANAAANRALEQLAQQDGLTGLANRRHLDAVLAREIGRARRYRRPLSLLLCDVDHFKLFNDRYGHLGGDRCLQQVAAVLSATSRAECDVAARYGGEEFALILPETDAGEALVVAERLRSSVSAMQIENDGPQAAARVTISLGLVTYSGEEEASGTELIGRADRALYEAKRGGRNRCVRH
jgi:diguanylate cyclase (GGDEF)-like protein